MNKDILFLENLYTLLDAGYSIHESLVLCYQILHDDTILNMIEKLKKGEDFSSILLKSSLPLVFKEYFSFYQNKNHLSESIEKSLSIYKTQKNFLSKMKSQLTYPCILLLFLMLFSIFVVFFLLPQVNQLFISFGIEKSIVIQIVFILFHVVPIVIMSIICLVLMMIIHLIYGLRRKKHHIIELYLKIPLSRVLLEKYFSLKFCIYYQELAQEDTDCATIINMLNKQMVKSDLKIVLYEIENRLYDGEAIEDILKDFEYFDQLFLTFFEMYLQNPAQHQSLSHYIELTYQQLEHWVSLFLRYLIPSIYSFVAIFVITIYISIVIPMMNIISDI